MNFIVFGVLAPIAYFTLRFLIKKLVMNLLQNVKRSSNTKNMIKCENCEIFFSEDNIKSIKGRNICNKPECKNNV